MLQLWKVKDVEEDVADSGFRVKVKFCDRWKKSVKQEVEKELSSLRLAFPLVLELYGVKRHRGRVNTIPVRGYRVVQDGYAGKYRIGVARAIRDGKDVDKLIDALKKYIGRISNGKAC